MGPQILGSKKIKVCKKLGLKNLVKIWSVTAEIFLIWTNVSRTNVKKGPRNLSLKFGPNWATNSWDIYFFGWVAGGWGEIGIKAISTSNDLN